MTGRDYIRAATTFLVAREYSEIGSGEIRSPLKGRDDPHASSLGQALGGWLFDLACIRGVEPNAAHAGGLMH